MAGALALVAPGQPLREGLERVLLAKRGALVVVGDDPAVLSICTGGFLFDAEFSPQRLSELAKMDGAIIVSADASRIARANVHLMPSSSIPTTETGTRHRTAERVARSMDVPVVSVSAAMGIVTVYRSVERHVLQPTARLHERVNQALQTLLRFRQRFDVAVATLSVLEVEDTVTVRDVAAVLQPAELAVRIAEEIEIALVELGEEGRLLRLQLEELIDGVDKIRRLVVRDYARQQGPACPVTPADGAAGHRGHGRGQRHAAMSAGGATTVAMAAAGGGASPVASGVSTRRAGSRTPGSGFVTKSGDAPGIDAADGHRRGAGTTDADGAGNTKSGDAPGVDAADGHRRGAGTTDADGAGTGWVAPDPEIGLRILARLGTDELLDTRRVAAALGIMASQVDLDASLEPRGYRMLHRLPRFPEVVLDRIVEHFAGLQRIMRASVGELEEVGGVGEARARTVKDGLARLAEANILDRYS